MAEQRREFDRETLAQVERLMLRARRVVEGTRVGSHRSPLHGASVEFAEHREYIPGDPLRNIDWKLYGKSDKYYVKRFEEETNLPATLLVDTSASMGYGRSRLTLPSLWSRWFEPRKSPDQRSRETLDERSLTKLEYATLLAAALAYLLVQQGDAVGLLTFGGGRSQYIPPRARGRQLHLLLEALLQARPAGEGGIDRILTEFAPRVSRRSLIIVISDLLEDPDAILQSMKSLRTRRNDVAILQIHHPDELEFPFDEVSRFEDPEDPRLELVADPREVRVGYLGELERFLAHVRSGCLAAHVEHHLVRTDEPVGLVMSRLMAERQKGRGR